MLPLMWRVTVNAPGPNDGRNWRLRYRAPTGVVRLRTAKTQDRDEAEAFARSEQARLNSTSDLSTILDVLDAYLEWVAQDVAPRTWINYQASRQVLAPLLGVPLHTMSPAWVEDLYGLLGNRRASTKRTHVYALAAAWNWAYERGKVQKPWHHPRRRRRKVANLKTTKRPLTPDELVRTLGAARGSGYFAIFWTLADTGCRLDELLSGRVEGDWLRVVGKTGALREIPLLPDTRKLILDGYSRCRRTARRAWQQALERACVPNEPDTSGLRPVYPIDLHSLRRTWISHSERAGVPRPVAMRVTGHELTGVHDSYMRHYAGDDLHEALRKVRDLRPGLIQVLGPGIQGLNP